MSTKTLRKRIALVAVATLGFGLVSIVPASADETTAAVVTATDDTLYTTVGTAITTVMKTTAVGATTEASGLTFTPTVTTKPAGSALSIAAPAAGKAGLTTDGLASPFATTAASAVFTTAASAGVVTAVWSAGTIPTTTTATAFGTLSITPDVPGVYQITVTPTATNNAGSPTLTAEIVYVIATAPSGTASGTSTMTATMSATVIGAGLGTPNATDNTTDPFVTVRMPLQAATVADTIKLKVIQSADADLPVNSVIDGDYATLIDETTAGASNADAKFTFNTVSSGLLSAEGLYSFIAFEDSDLNGNWTSGENYAAFSFRLAGTATTYSYTLNPSTVSRGDTFSLDLKFYDDDG